MAKRKPKAEVVDTGIYKRFYVDGKPARNIGGNAPSDYGVALTKWLSTHEGWALEKLGPLPEGDDRKRNHQLHINQQVLEVVEWIRWIRSEVEAGADPRILYGAVQAGHAFEELYAIVNGELHANRGKGTLRSASMGGKTRRSLDDKEAGEAKAERDRLITAGLSKHDACTQVGEAYRVSYKTISRL